jgi:hypothetical protein
MSPTPDNSVTTNANGVAQIASSPTWNNTADQTTQGQLTGIISQNSPLLQQARTDALQQANSRGLLNSSIAQTAGDSAVYNAAVPIAQSDAAQASKVAQTNVANTNADIGTNLASQNQSNTANIEAQYKDLTQGSASASQLVSNAQNNIAQILQNTNMDAGAKQAAIDQIKGNLQNSMGMIGSLAGNVDLQQYNA